MILAAAAVLAGGGDRPAAAQQACAEYTVRPGDTLRRIARRAYGDEERFRAIHDANRAVIGPRPGAIEIGMVLRLPCADGSLPGTDAAAPGDSAPMPADAPADAEAPGTIGIAVMAGPAPLANPAQPGMGLLVELVARAFEAAPSGPAPEFVAAPDGFVATAPALAGGPFAIALPAWQPDCRARRAGGEDPCRGLVFSAPLHEVELALYAPRGRRVRPGAVCMPAGLIAPPPDMPGLLPEGAAAVPAPDMAACLDALAGGRAQAVLVSPDQVAPQHGLRPLPRSRRRWALVAVAAEDRAEAVAAIARLDRALRDVLRGEDWPAAVAAALSLWRQRRGEGG